MMKCEEMLHNIEAENWHSKGSSLKIVLKVYVGSKVSRVSQTVESPWGV